MLLLPIFQTKKLNYVVLFLMVTCIGIVKSQQNNTLKVEADSKTPAVVVEQKSVKKELRVNITDGGIVEITPRNEKGVHHADKLVTIDEKYIIKSSVNALEQQQTAQKTSEKTNILKTDLTKGSLQPQNHQHHLDEEFILNDEDDLSESLKTGFYFFLILSSGAILFIIYKIYSLRLSRAERKYGVQGDRSSQELTPLPISIEDGNSDDEDQTLFDIQRQNVRIL